MAACDGRPRFSTRVDPERATETGDATLLEFDLGDSIPEGVHSDGLLPTPPSKTYATLLETIRAARENEQAKGVLVKLGAASHNWAQSEELGREFASLRQSGRAVVCHADQLDNRSLWLAAQACEQVWVSPAGSVDSVGPAGESLYLRQVLEKLNVQVQFLHMGKYKSAAEMFTRDDPSQATREAMGALFRSMRESWIAGVAEHRADPQAAAAAENGPWIPKAAQAIGLIDRVGFESDARRQLEELTKQSEDDYISAFGARKQDERASVLAEIFRMLAGADTTEAAHVTILPAIGSIAMEGGGSLGDDGIVARSVVRTVRRLKEDRSVKAVVLRIDSPGGSALASDLIWHELMQLRAAKPLIASVGAMAASGGYYLASAAEHVFAERTSIVGSIGVVGGKLSFGETLSEWGITSHAFTPYEQEVNHRRALMLSPFVPWDEATQGRVREQMARIYQLFLERVSEGRSMPVEQIHDVAQGRVWTGSQGKEHGLVDTLGGLAEAVARAKQRAGLPAEAPVTIQRGKNGLLEMLGLSEASNEQEVHAALVQFERRMLRRLEQAPGWWRALSPRQRAQLQSLLPMLQGEHVLTALPYTVEPR